MPAAAPPPPHLDELVQALIDSYESDDRTQHLDATFLPSRARTIDLVECLRRLLFPGFFDDERVTRGNVRYHLGEGLTHAHALLHDQVHQALRYDLNVNGNAPVSNRGGDHEDCESIAGDKAADFLNALPELRRRLALDVQAIFDGDPAARSTDEVIFCYPGLDAIFIHRIAHALYRLDIPLLPRIMAEYAHNETGIDIHPGATIADSFCIDHGTGVVIGETCRIGRRVKIYQGVTLGALSTKGGQDYRGMKRHPDIGDDVTIYGGAVILGGATTIGRGATIGGAVFITRSIPEYHTVTMESGDLKITPQRKRGKASDEATNFQI